MLGLTSRRCTPRLPEFLDVGPALHHRRAGRQQIGIGRIQRRYPGAADGRTRRSKSPTRVSLPRFHYRVGLHIVLFEICSAFTHVAACTLAQSPYFVTAIRGFQTFLPWALWLVAAACTQGKRAQHGKPQGVIRDDQPEAREGQAGRSGVAERPAVPLKPGNAG
jgi:hypothetical protein